MPSTKQIESFTCQFSDKISLNSKQSELTRKEIFFKNKDTFEGFVNKDGLRHGKGVHFYLFHALNFISYCKYFNLFTFYFIFSK